MGLVLNDPCVVGANVLDIWQSGSVPSYQAGLGRFGRSALRLGGGNTVTKTIASNPAEIWFAFAFWMSSFQTDSELASGWDLTANQEQVGLYKVATGQLRLKRGDGTVLATSPDLLLTNTWYHGRLHLVIDSVNGKAEFFLNGSPNAWMSFTGNTRRTANNLVNSARLLNFDEHRFCDIYLLDPFGAPSTDQGDLLINVAQIIGDSATPGKNTFSNQPAQIQGAHYLNIDESPAVDTDYNFSSVVGAIERYRFSMPTNVPPRWVAGRLRVQNDNAGTHNVVPGFGRDLVEVDGPVFSTPSSPAYSPHYCAVIDPATGDPWQAGAQTTEFYGKIIT